MAAAAFEATAAAVWAAPRPFAELPPLPRLVRLRQDLLAAPYGLCTQKAERLTEFHRAYGRRHWLTRAIAPLHYALMRRALDRTLGRGVPQSPRQLRFSNHLQRLYQRLDQGRAVTPPVVTAARWPTCWSASRCASTITS
jgi:formate C-acetyltransferase